MPVWLLPTLIKYATDWRVIAGVSFAVLLLALGVEHARLTHAKADLTRTRVLLAETIKADKAALDQCHANNATLNAALASQEAAVQAVKAEGDRATANAAKAVSAAHAATATASAKVAAILASKGSTCADLEGLRGMQ